MTVKKIFRSTAAKLVAFLVVVGCVAGAVTQAEYGIMNMLRWSNDSELVYRLEDRFEDSQLVNGLVSTTVADLDYALHEGLDQETFDRRFSGANFIGDYYGRMGDRVLKNSDLTEEEAASSLFLPWRRRTVPCILVGITCLCHCSIPMSIRRREYTGKRMCRKTA